MFLLMFQYCPQLVAFKKNIYIRIKYIVGLARTLTKLKISFVVQNTELFKISECKTITFLRSYIPFSHRLEIRITQTEQQINKRKNKNLSGSNEIITMFTFNSSKPKMGLFNDVYINLGKIDVVSEAWYLPLV